MAETLLDLDVPIGDVVKAWRIRRGLSSTDFAALAGISKGYLSELEHHKIAQPGRTRLAQLAAALDISVGDLLMRRMPPAATSTVPAGVARRRASLSGPPFGSRTQQQSVTTLEASGGECPEREVDQPSAGQELDAELLAANLSWEEREAVRRLVIPHAKQLAHFVKGLRQG